MTPLALALNGAAARLSTLTGWRRRGAAVLFGLLAALALPPVYALPLLWIAFSGLVWLLDGAEGSRRSFADGWWFGFGYFSAGLYWIAYALLVDPVRYGWMVPFAVFGLGGLLGVFTGVAAWAAHRWSAPGLGRVLALASAWVLLEWLRSWVLTGFPWNLIGSVWLGVLPVAQFAALAGSYGLSLVTVAVAAMPALLRRPGPIDRWAVFVSLAGLLAIALWGSLRLADGPLPPVPGIRLRLVQANIEQTLKWVPEMRFLHLQKHLDLTLSPGWDKVTDVIWPETAAPSFLERDAQARRLMAAATPPGGLLITGAVRGTPPGEQPFRVWNSLEALNAQAEIVGVYDKAHLVPFGEYMPLHDLLPLVKITAGDVDFSAGPGVRSLALPGLPAAGPLICYEVIFPGAVVDRPHRPAWLLNVTNDGWYGISAEPYQHLAASRLRAIEEGLPLVRVANTGISAVVDSFGRVMGEIPLGTEGILDMDLPSALPADAPYSKYGNPIPIFMALAIALGAFLEARLVRQG